MDTRKISAGASIPVVNYSDQPYIVKGSDGSWVLCVTTGSGHEGAQGQHIATARSVDQGQTWTDFHDLEPSDGPESSYAVMYRTPYGRIYCFYNYNADDRRYVAADEPPFPEGKCFRVDSQGHFVFRYSDDDGRSWSSQHWEVPMRKFQVDLDNPYHGDILFFWNVGRPFENQGQVFIPLYKIGRFGEGFMYHTECALLCCENLDSQQDVDQLRWSTLPEGDVGIRVNREISPISEEHSFVTLSDGSVFCVFRTTTGHPYCCYSRDNCRSFSTPEPMCYENGQQMKHPRAANFIWKCENGKYLYWFHNHGGTWYEDRNPVWVSGAQEYQGADGLRLKFSYPEILLFDEDIMVRMSYPDLVEDQGKYFVTETQKRYARTHEISKTILDAVWGRTLSLPPETVLTNGCPMPGIDPFLVHSSSSVDGRSEDTGSSFAFSLTVDLPDENQVLFSTMTQENKGIRVLWNAASRQIEFYMGDSRRMSMWNTDPGSLDDPGTHTVTIAVDGSARIITMFTDGNFCDGGMARQFGFGWFDRMLISAAGLSSPFVAASVKKLRWFGGFVYNAQAKYL